MKKVLLGAALMGAGLLMPCHPAQAAGAEELRAKFGRDCITGQTFAAVYYGFKPEEHNGGRGNFYLHRQVSGAVSAQVAPLSVSQIRKAMSGGKRNGEFQDYKEAYRAVSSLCEMETTEEKQYGLVYFDNDATPELVVGKKGYWTSLYTYRDGRVYTLMDSWAYGVSFLNGKEATPAECAACDAGGYEYLEGSMTAGELQEKLK